MTSWTESDLGGTLTRLALIAALLAAMRAATAEESVGVLFVADNEAGGTAMILSAPCGSNSNGLVVTTSTPRAGFVAKGCAERVSGNRLVITWADGDTRVVPMAVFTTVD